MQVTDNFTQKCETFIKNQDVIHANISHNDITSAMKLKLKR